MENELQQAHDALERMVAERTRDLAQTVDTLQNEIAEHKIAEEKILHMNRLYAVLSGTNQAIVKAADRDSLFQVICLVAVEQGGFLMAWVGLVDDASGMVQPVATCGINEGYLDDIRISVREEPEGLGSTGRAIRDGSLCIASNIMDDPRFAPWRTAAEKRGYRSTASLPLKLNDKAIGALTIYAGEKDFFDWQVADLLQRMATDISFALDNLDRGVRRREAERVLQNEIVERLRVSEELREKERLLILQSRQAAMGEMINNIAHQWRQPLNNMSLTVQILREIYHDGECSDEYMEDSVNQIMRLIQHMSQTIDDFRNFFRPDREMRPFNLKEKVCKILVLVNDSFKVNNIAVDMEAEEDLFITGYPNEYCQVLLNILNNARDALIERTVASPRITIHLFREDNKIVATISDNAGGIPATIINRIFEPYFTTKDVEQGTGIGLYIAKAIIEKRFNGKISAQNKDQGAEFRIEVWHGGTGLPSMIVDIVGRPKSV
jgi:C4-dicarboxylate-specific signal transduction histidine kinase